MTNTVCPNLFVLVEFEYLEVLGKKQKQQTNKHKVLFLRGFE